MGLILRLLCVFLIEKFIPLQHGKERKYSSENFIHIRTA